jgi:hypothetical protein
MRTVNHSTAPDAIAELAEFQNSGKTLTGGPATPYPGYGRLPEEWRREIARCAAAGNPPVYYVHSYATPIGWLLKDGTAVIPQESYSVTTSKHQGRVRVGWDGRRQVTRVDELQEA